MTNVNEKVRIPKEVAEAIESLREAGVHNRVLLSHKSMEESRKCCPDSYKDEFTKILRYLGEDESGRTLFINEVTEANLHLAIINGYEIEQPPKKITLELTPEELGYIICDMEVVCTGEAEDAANERGINYNWRDCDSLYRRLINLYEEEARA